MSSTREAYSCQWDAKSFAIIHMKSGFLMHKGVTIWFTGLSGSGKTTIASRLHEVLQSRNILSERLDGDVVRQSAPRGLGFSKEGRDKNIERVTFVTKLLTRNGVVSLVAFISPYR